MYNISHFNVIVFLCIATVSAQAAPRATRQPRHGQRAAVEHFFQRTLPVRPGTTISISGEYLINIQIYTYSYIHI